MPGNQFQSIEMQLESVAGRFELVLVPGLYDSDIDHWQSHWHQRFSGWRRIAQRDWNQPDVESWIDAISRTLAQCERPAILIGHSLGALASCALVASRDVNVAGLMLVAPAEPARFELDDRVPHHRLNVPGVLVASHDDPLLRFERAHFWANTWGCLLVDVGEAGHINAEAGYGPWPHGLVILSELIRSL
ncbi:Serine hydrolase [Caballeronia sp. SBC1]|uniref:RBBP9/YdeN family alpha/beta hydrolase n=1 Tax=unclassified Caballeronia TaxID=2646786 RepID=UPI0013E0F607|nr:MULTISPECIES: alpha/beta hydrolase [unclassified Caballeronia]QIE25449.1 Serine hydrolase [Caballeronia sp. SBC2]QIN63499.1 Serine hydrolase [Caballeronia sp. SBC1]